LGEAEPFLEEAVGVVQEGDVLSHRQSAQHRNYPKRGIQLLQIRQLYFLVLGLGCVQ